VAAAKTAETMRCEPIIFRAFKSQFENCISFPDGNRCPESPTAREFKRRTRIILTERQSPVLYWDLLFAAYLYRQVTDVF
jgi:hypothetical protein